MSNEKNEEMEEENQALKTKNEEQKQEIERLKKQLEEMKIDRPGIQEQVASNGEGEVGKPKAE